MQRVGGCTDAVSDPASSSKKVENDVIFGGIEILPTVPWQFFARNNRQDGFCPCAFEHMKRAWEEEPDKNTEVVGAIALAAAPHDWGPLLRNGLPPAPADDVFRLVTYNCNGVRNRVNNGRPEGGFVLALRSMRPSVLALQEVKIARAEGSQLLLKFSAATLRSTPWAAPSAPAEPKLTAQHLNLPDKFKSQPGVATLLGPGVDVARAEFDLPARFRSDAGGDDVLFRLLTLWLPSQRIVLVNVYAPNSGDDGKNADRRARWDCAFRSFLGALSRAEPLVWPAASSPRSDAAAQPADAEYAGRLVVVGDLNILPTDADYVRPQGMRVAGASAEERAAHARLLGECGLHDVGARAGHTFVNSNWRGRGVLAARFDGVLVSEALLEAVERIWVADHAPRGDHLPLCVDFKFARATVGAGASLSPVGVAATCPAAEPAQDPCNASEQSKRNRVDAIERASALFGFED